MQEQVLALDTIDRRILVELQRDCALTNQELARRVHISAATCLRRVRWLVEQGVVERQIAIVSPERIGAGLTAIVEITLDRQDAGSLAQFEQRVGADAAVQQCYRVSSGPDFVLVILVADMDAYHALVHRLFTAAGNVRNVRAFFSIRRSKFAPAIPL
jgi:Lrp/AsnC family leucine-responsive transcriptional regulator